MKLICQILQVLNVIANFNHRICMHTCSFFVVVLFRIKDDCLVATFSSVHHADDIIHRSMLLQFCALSYVHRLYFRGMFWPCHRVCWQIDRKCLQAALCVAFVRLTPSFAKSMALELAQIDFHRVVSCFCPWLNQIDFDNLKQKITKIKSKFKNCRCLTNEKRRKKFQLTVTTTR